MQEYELECANMLLAVWLFTFLVGVQIHLYAAIPAKSSGYVHDFAGILDIQTETELTSLITQVEQKTSAEIAVVTVSSLDGMPVQEYANKLFNLWGIGKKGKDNGVLVLVAPNERQMWIEVGYGLEPILPDGLSGEIYRQQFVPAFKQGNFSAGIIAGVTRIAQIIEKGEPAPKTSFARQFPQSEAMPWFLRFFLFLFLLPFVVIGGSLFGGMIAAFKQGKFSNAVPILFIALFWNGIVSVFEFIAGPMVWVPHLLLFMFLASMVIKNPVRHIKNRGRKGFWETLAYSASDISSGSIGGGSSWSSGGFSGGFSGGSFGGGSSGGGGVGGSW